MVNEYFFLKKIIMITLEKKNHLRKYVIRLKKKKLSSSKLEIT